MKTISGKVAIFAIYENGRLLDRGPSIELANKYYVRQEEIPKSARTGCKMLGQYTVVREADQIRPELAERYKLTAELHKKGLTAREIGVRLGVSPITVNKYLRDLREKGEIE